MELHAFNKMNLAKVCDAKQKMERARVLRSLSWHQRVIYSQRRERSTCYNQSECCDQTSAISEQSYEVRGSPGSANHVGPYVQYSCICTPTTHAGSFKCRIHKASERYGSFVLVVHLGTPNNSAEDAI
ncbi:hypothetical protein KP509_31G036900 [Ceratopteris richardii]|uniref:Uncharacterized protein n=1 Tax=Ceratopteris richardii TaxID=49495 RepID=A0A8T2QYL7_CERRI|nr:hypothetical protein KP509_31G036900 [Ceratopteris richardii]